MAIFLIVGPLMLRGQDDLDSLWGVWENMELHDTVRAEVLGPIFKKFLYTQPDSAFSIASMQLVLAEKLAHQKLIAQAQINQGRARLHQSRFKEAMEYFQLGLATARVVRFASGEASALNNMGIVLESTGDYARAIDHYMQSLKIREEEGNKQGGCRLLNQHWARVLEPRRPGTCIGV